MDSHEALTVKQKTRHGDGVLIGTMWCPLEQEMKKIAEVSLKDTRRDLFDPRMQLQGQFVGVQDHCLQ